MFKAISRRDFMKGVMVGGAALGSAGLLSACGSSSSSSSSSETVEEETSTADTGTETAATEEAAAATESSGFSEAPSLTEQVEAGTLPALEDRIPTADDVYVETVEEVGQYGGSLKMSLTSAGWNTGKPIEEGLFAFDSDGNIEPNVAQGYDVSDDYKVYTIYLREGMKWSDGEDFTAADCVFFYDHMCVPETFGKSLWDCFKVTDDDGNETTCTLEQVDDYTFTVTFEAAKSTFIQELCINAKWLFTPMHYMVEILPEYVGDDAAAAKATEMGFADTSTMLKQTGYYYWNVPGVPTLNPYVLSTEDGKDDVDGNYFEFLRNPYYWKVDQNGQQLPYTEKIEYTMLSDDSQGLTMLLGGNDSITGVAWADIETVTENADTVGYNVVTWSNSSWADNASQLELNQTAPDEAYRELFQTQDFRQALSIAVDRDEYSKLISDGWQEGAQASPAEGALGYSEEWRNKWTDYDPEGAMALLEGLGMTMGSDGYYTLPDGSAFTLSIYSYTGSGADDTYQVLDSYWKAIGINTTYKSMDKDTLNNLITSNEYDAVLSPVAPAETISLGVRPDTLVPVRNYAEWYGEIGTWYASGGTEGVEPTGDLLELCNLYTELKNTVDEDARNEIIMEMYGLHEENIWVIGYMEAATTLYAVDNNLHNFPSGQMFCDEYRGLRLAHIWACWLDDAE
ncbi:MAG: ABC transporter substrate-binding protein [Lachnospiraceae bacterium]|nr:ABC transporter substrate-binding protein [Lachnospiraceae bacterium]